MMGALVTIAFLLQVISGVLVLSTYSNVDTFAVMGMAAMDSHLAATVLCTIHTAGVNVLFFAIALHLVRAVIFSSTTNAAAVLASGLLLFVLMFVVALTGYSLAGSQLSLWAIVIISNVINLSAYGLGIMGGFTVSSVTLSHFVVLHMALSIVSVGLMIVHLLALHTATSNADHGGNNNNMVGFWFVAIEDLLLVFVVAVLLSVTVVYVLVSHGDSFVAGNVAVSPSHIVPSWYLLPLFALLRVAMPALSLIFIVAVVCYLPLINSIISIIVLVALTVLGSCTATVSLNTLVVLCSLVALL